MRVSCGPYCHHTVQYIFPLSHRFHAPISPDWGGVCDLDSCEEWEVDEVLYAPVTSIDRPTFLIGISLVIWFRTIADFGWYSEISVAVRGPIQSNPECICHACVFYDRHFDGGKKEIPCGIEQLLG